MVLLLVSMAACGSKSNDDSSASGDDAGNESANSNITITDMDDAISKFNLDVMSSEMQPMSEVRLSEAALLAAYENEIADFDKHPSGSMTIEEVSEIIGADPSSFFAVSDGEERIFRWFTEDTDAAYVSIGFEDKDGTGVWVHSSVSNNL